MRFVERQSESAFLRVNFGWRAFYYEEIMVTRENLNYYEKSLMRYICNRYKENLAVKFSIPLCDCEKIGIKNYKELENLLASLQIRNYISCILNEENGLCSPEITLTEKALNLFNLEF